MTAAQYVGRTFDVVALGGAKTVGDVLLRTELFGVTNAGSVCTGIQKMAQRWVTEFCTIRGSMPWHMRTRGTDFMTYLQAGMLRTEFDVQSIYSTSAVQARQSLSNEDTGAEPADERFDYSELTGIVLSPGRLELYITLYSMAGDSREIILPITTTPANLVV